MPPLLHGEAEAGRHRRPGRALRAALRPEGQEVVASAGESADRLAHLRSTKLGALVAQHWGKEHPDKDTARLGERLPFVGGAALLSPDGGVMWVLIDDGEVSRFGPALALADTRGASSLEVLVEEAVPGAASVIARRAAELASPPGVWSLSGREVLRAEPAPAEAELSAVGCDPALAEVLASHGADPVVEHGVLRGEVLGLEVARVIGGRLVVGVGRHDRDARLEMRPGEDVGAALEEAVAAVRERRRPGAARHPANTLARSRWLRAVLCARPSVVGASVLEVTPPPLPWFDLPEAGAAPCVGTLVDGSPVVAVCSVGVDLDLVPTAADCRLLYRPGARLLLVVPEGDDLPVNRRLADRLAQPADVVTVPRDWESLPDGAP